MHASRDARVVLYACAKDARVALARVVPYACAKDARVAPHARVDRCPRRAKGCPRRFMRASFDARVDTYARRGDTRVVLMRASWGCTRRSDACIVEMHASMCVL